MPFQLTESQEMFKTTARKFLTDNCPATFVREMFKDEQGYSSDLWRKMADLGWLGLMVPEEFGGSGESFLSLGLLMEEMGRCCLPSPYFSTSVLGALTILEGGNQKQKEKILSEICKGNVIVTIALTEPNAEYDPSAIITKAISRGDNYLLNGTKLFVPEAHVSDYIICVARTGAKAEALSLFLMDTKNPGVKSTLLKTITGEKQCEVIFDGAVATKDDLIGEIDQGWQLIQRVLPKAIVAKCLEMVGGAEQVLEMTVSYASTRVQSGHPIGYFQSIQHHCANMLLYLELMRHLSYKAAWLLDQGLPCDKEVAMAKACASENYRKITFLGHQIHGGIGFCEDHAMPLYFKRAKAAELSFGDADYHLEKVAQEIGL